MFLSRILEAKKLEVADRLASTPLSVLERLVADADTPRDFLGSIRRPGLGVIAEIKRASPSKGPLRLDLDPAALARQYELGGAVAISVLTDGPHFGAKPGDLQAVRAAVGLPVLRKDFLVNEYQLWESRAMGADAALLIVAALDPPLLSRLIALARELGICPLVEVHNGEELKEAVDAGAELLGINNRDLHTFRVDLETTHRLMPLVPKETAVVSESGIAGPEAAAAVCRWGADALLVGEALVTSDDPVGLLRSLAACSEPLPSD